MSELLREKMVVLKKPPTAIRPERRTYLEAVSTQAATVGGSEGLKHWLTLKSPLFSPTSGRLTLKYFLKENSYRTLESLENLILRYIELRKLGLPVPNMTRMVEVNGSWHLVMSDITENGRYLVWGFSDNMSLAQLEELAQMKLTKKDLHLIEAMVEALFVKAEQVRQSLRMPFIHVRRDTQTGELDLILLDVDSQNNWETLEHYRIIRSNQEAEKKAFLAELKDHRAKVTRLWAIIANLKNMLSKFVR